MKKSASKCCKKFRKKSKACSKCPLMARLAKGERKELLARYANGKKKAKA